MGMSHLGEFITGSNATSYSTTSSYAPTADRLLIAVVRNVNNLVTDPATPTFSGNGLTWTQVFTYLPDPTGTKSRITVFAALTGSSPTSGVGTADFGAETQLGCTVFVEEVDNADLSGTALDAIVQAVQGTQSGSGTSESIALAALSDAGNITYGFFSVQSQETFVAGSGYTILHQGVNGGPNTGVASEYQEPGSTTVDISWTNSAGKGGIALEIKVAGGSSTTTLVADAGSFSANGQAANFSTTMIAEHGSFT